MVVKVDDQRVFERFMARFPTKFKDSRNDFGSNVFLRDISADGVRIASRERLFPKDSIDLLVDLPDGHNPMSLKGRVMWIKGVDSNSWEAGLKFNKVNLMSTHRIFKFCQ